MSILTGLGCLALTHAGLVALAMAMDRHHRQLRPSTASHTAPGTLGWKLAGWLLLALSLQLSTQNWGVGTGLVAWCGIATAAALALILMLPFAPALAWRSGWMAGAAGLAMALAA